MYQVSKKISFKEGVIQTYSGVFGILVTVVISSPVFALAAIVIGLAVKIVCKAFMFGFNWF